MNPHKVTVDLIFTMHSRHLVPIFQRQYVWGEQDQWAPLWQDVILKAQELLTVPLPGRQPRKHFMGAVVLRGIPPTGLGYQAYEVIDGQQRLTTLQLLLIALRDYSRERELTPITNLLTGMTQNPPYVGAEYEQWKVIPTTRDRQDFQDVLEAGSPDELLRRRPPVRRKYFREPDPPPRILGAYYFFFAAIRRFTETNQDFDDESLLVDETIIARRVEALVRAITQQLEIVRIDLDQDDDPQIIFETLNARGVRLLPSDLVRNYIFLEATRQYGAQARIQELYNTYWRSYDETKSASFWKEPVRQGRLINPRFELFLFHFLTSQLSRLDEDIQLTHLYRAFGDWWHEGPAGGRDVEQALQIIQRYSVFYQRLFAADNQERIAVFGRRMKTMDVSTVYPLLLFLFVEREQDTANEVEGILDDLESYLVRRMVCGLTTKSYNRIFLKMLTDLRRGGIVNRAEVQQHLLSLTGPTAEWPTDEQFHERWLTSKVYENLRQARVVMILEALEWSEYGPLQERDRPPSGTAYSIEHILPQKPEEVDWPLPVSPDDEEIQQNVLLTREILKHTFGNLTLVTTPMNSKLSNGPFAAKEDALTNESTLMLNRYFSRHDITTWDEARIRERGERLFNRARTIWSRPNLEASA